MLRSKLFDGLKRISTPLPTRNPHRDGTRRRRGFRRPRLECLERRELLSLSGWSFAMGGPDNDFGRDTAVDTAGNVYVTGQFSDTVDFDPGPGVEELTSQGGVDVFVAKYYPDGKLDWARSYDYQEDYYPPSAIAVDFLGNATVTFGEEHIWRLNANGDTEWSHTIVSPGRVDARDVAVDADGDIYITGFFTETADFGDTAGGQTISLTSAGTLDIFVAKYAPTGEVIWAQRAGSADGNGRDKYRNDWASGIAVDGQDIYLTGRTFTGADFGSETVSLPEVTKARSVIFVAKMNADGAFQWVSAARGTIYYGYDEDVTVDSNGDVYIVGHFSGSTSFGDHTINSVADIDAFAVKLDPAGNFLWARGMGGLGRDLGYSVSADDVGNVYVAGVFGAAGDIGPFELPPNDPVYGGAGFLAKLDAIDGAVLSAQEIGWGAYSVSVGSDGSLHLTGGLAPDASGEEFPTGETLYGSSGDIYVSKLEPGAPGIRRLLVSPDPIAQGGTLTLSAHGVLDIGGRVTSVAFYRDANGDGLLDAGDVPLGTDTDVSDAWSFSVDTTGLALGTHTFFAVATDNDGTPSDAATAIGEVVDDSGQPEVYNSTDTPLAIADAHPRKGPKTTTSELVISSPDSIGSLELVISLDDGSSNVSDLTATLTSPDNTTQAVLLASGTTTYADFGFVGESLGGTWTLAITDSVKRNTHTLNSWSLTVTPVPAGEAGSAALLAFVEQEASSEPVNVISGPERIDLANGRYDPPAAAVDHVLRLRGYGLNLADPLDDLPSLSAGKQDNSDAAIDQLLAEIDAGLPDEELVGELALA